MEPRRRDWLRLALGLAALGAAPPVAAADLPRLSESDPLARQLGYRHDAESVDDARFPQRRAQAQTCGNCQLFYGARAGWGECTVFPGKQVSEAGWCRSWAPNMG